MRTVTIRGRLPRRSAAALPIVITLVSLLAAGTAGADRTSFWTQETFDSFVNGSLAGAAVMRDGAITVSAEMSVLDVPGAQYVWAGGERNGAFVVAVGSPGAVYEIRNGRAEELLASDTADYSAFAVSPSGDIYVGTSPGGAVYRIRPDGSAGLFFETGEGYVWSLAYSAEHGLLVGTGDLAKVYAVDDDGEGRVLHESTEASISVISASGDRVLAGTNVGGLLLDVTPGSDLSVLYDSPYEEISGIVQPDDGSVYFAATSVSMEDAMNEGSQYDSGFGEGAVYRTTAAGGAVRVWSSTSAPVTALGVTESGEILAGTGARGLLYSIGGDGSADLVAELDGEMVLSMSPVGSGLLACVGLPGGAVVIGDGPADSGTYLSDVLDTRSASVWGEVEWRAEYPAGGEVTISARSGNTETPDDTWSDWHEVRGAGGGAAGCPGARYVQWRAELSSGSGGASPLLRSVTVAYLRENLPPVVGSVKIFDPDDVVTGPAGGNSSTVSQSLPGGVEITYSLDAAEAEGHMLPALVRGMRTVSWEALDPDGDPLAYEVWVRAEDESEWKPMERDIHWRTLHTWDTGSMADGHYRMKVVASDRPANPAGSALEAEAVSAVFTVDHTPPEIARLEVSESGGALTVSGLVTDAAHPVSRVEVSLDYGEWRRAFAADGILDSRSESFELVLDDAGPGEHTVAVRALDRAGNMALARKLVR
jgi:hypothetical protein